MSGWPDIEHLQELVVQLPPEDAELINRLERTRLTLEFMLAGVRRPTTHEEGEPRRARATSLIRHAKLWRHLWRRKCGFELSDGRSRSCDPHAPNVGPGLPSGVHDR